MDLHHWHLPHLHLPHLHLPKKQPKLTLEEAENLHWAQVPRLIGWGKTLFFGGLAFLVILFTLDPPFALLLGVTVVNWVLAWF
ncbi:MAG: hypothetical protein QNL04_01695 [SAR324 cluster bacterium]|nr:hypothetical protein [SAR324 cluster bacterium]